MRKRTKQNVIKEENMKKKKREKVKNIPIMQYIEKIKQNLYKFT